MDLADLDPRLVRITCAGRAVSSLTRDDLGDIAAHGQRHSRTQGLSGLLLYIEGDFLQVLEGPRSAVERLYEAIEADPRHQWVTRLATERILRRAFGDWSMGCCGAGLRAGEGDAFFVLDPAAPRVRPRFNGDFLVFLRQFCACEHTRGRDGGFARTL